MRGRISVDVSASGLDGVRLALAPGTAIKVRIIPERAAKPDLSGLDFFLTANGKSGFGSPRLESDRFTMQNVPPDHYVLKLSGSLLRKSYVKSVRTGETDVLADGLTVTGPGTIDIEIVVAFDTGGLEGVVRDENQQPVPGATILLAPDWRSRTDLFRSTTAAHHTPDYRPLIDHSINQ